MYIQGGRVPPGATVQFDVQLLSVKRRGTNPVSSQVCTVKKIKIKRHEPSASSQECTCEKMIRKKVQKRAAG